MPFLNVIISLGILVGLVLIVSLFNELLALAGARIIRSLERAFRRAPRCRRKLEGAR
jgi:hypothetical protein